MNPKSRLFTLLLCLGLLLALSGCVSSLPASTSTAPTATMTEDAAVSEPAGDEANAADAPAAPALGPAPQSSPAVTATEAITVTEPVTSATGATGTVPASAAASGLSPDKARDLALAYLAAGYQMDPGDPSAFAPANLKFDTEGYTAQTSYTSGPWQLFVLTPQEVEGRTVTPVVLANTKNDSRWWGEVGDDELVVTTVATGLPRPRSRDIAGWVGTVTPLPAGSPYNDYFEGLKGNRYGFDSADPKVSAILAGLGEYKGRIKVSGEVQFAQPDYNGRRLLVKSVELLETPATEDAGAPQASSTPAAPAQPPAEPAAAPGASGAFNSPLPGALLSGAIDVAGDAAGLFENKVVIQVEAEDGTILGKGILITDAADMGKPGHFSGSISFDNPPKAGKGRLAIYAEDPADGSLDLISWVNVKLAAAVSGMSAAITEPAAGAKVQKQVSVKGAASGVGDRPLVVRVEDAAGNILGQKRVKMEGAQESEDWSAEIGLRAPRSARPGRIVVYVTADDGSLTPLASVKVDLTR